MSNKVDKLFKDKLGEHSLPPSAQAWGKIEANLAKKNKGIIWFRIAAVLALFGLLTLVWMRNGRETLPQQMATKHPAKVEKDAPAPITKEKTSLAHQSIKEEKIKKEKENKTASNTNKETTTQPEQIVTTKNTTPIALVKEEKADEQKIEEKKTETPALNNTVAVAAAAPKKSIKLTFSLPALKEETVQPQEAVAAATPEEKKTSFQKAVEKANDIRTGDVLGSLRDAKDNLFAWEFKKDKTKKTTLN